MERKVSPLRKEVEMKTEEQPKEVSRGPPSATPVKSKDWRLICSPIATPCATKTRIDGRGVAFHRRT